MKTMKVSPPLKWHGGKHYLASRIVALMPPHIHYVEPFAGGLSVLLAKDPEGVSEVVNDLNGDLSNFWQVLQSVDTWEDFRDAKLHLTFFYRQFARLLKPGRVVVVHVAQIPRMKRAGGRGLFDFRGMNIRLAERAGLTFEYDWVVRKNPQAQAIRGKAWELKFQGVETDRSMSRGALPDYLLKFRAPGANTLPIDSEGDVSRNDWIQWAECCWGDIKETDTLNTRAARAENDTRHICPLQLPVIDRLVRLYTNPGELVFSPFAGIGSEGYAAILRGRRFYGCELKDEYHARACVNLAEAVRKWNTKQQPDLFAEVA